MSFTPSSDPAEMMTPLPVRRVVEPSADTLAVRAEKAEVARQGTMCPVNQHGCFYFAAHECVCELCSWQAGNAAGFMDGSLTYMGGPVEKHSVDINEGNFIKISKKELDELFLEMKTFKNVTMNTFEWHRVKHNGKLPENYINYSADEDPGVFTRTQLHNHLMVHGAGVRLTDEKWDELRKRWPSH